MAEGKVSCRNGRWSLEGMTALVTGGTRGIGYTIVEELAGFGARVHTCSRNEKEIKEKVEEWERKGFKISGSVCDVSIREHRHKLIADVSSAFDGKLNILVNNAAILGFNNCEDYSEEEYASIMKTNLEGPYNLCQLAYPLLKASQDGSIVFISSIAGIVSLPMISVYAAAKGALNQLTKNLGCEWAKDKIRTNTVAPGGTRSTLSNSITNEITQAVMKAYGNQSSQLPICRLAEPEEVSALVAFLCLPAASYINGQVICVDGGFTINGLLPPSF